MSKIKTLSMAAIALSLSFGAVHAAPIAPPVTQFTVDAATEAPVTQVQYRRHGGGGGGWRGRGWRGPGIGLGIGAGLLAGAIIADRSYAPRRGYHYDSYASEGPYYYPQSYGGDPRRICAQNFKSFEWNTGMYTTYGGERRLCPYLN